jgi:hypothetical protein
LSPGEFSASNDFHGSVSRWWLKNANFEQRAWQDG